MPFLIENFKCTGCMACKQICPRKCIVEKKDNLGNLHPIIEEKNCIQCGLCTSVCPEINLKNINFKNINNAYAAWSLNKKTRSSSASGGLASEFYYKALQQGYWISGVEYADKFRVVHSLSKDEKKVKEYRQSKYVFSDTDDIYIKIKQKLDCNEKVLFISLPCKIAGLLLYLKKEYKNLLTVDIVCHGTPPYQNLDEHIQRFDCSSKTKKLRFRYDNEFVFELKSSEGKPIYAKKGLQDAYLAAFLKGLNYRMSCYNCSYARKERISDITISDFWGLGSDLEFNHPYTGAISAVLINSKKGAEFFDTCKSNLFVEERPIWEAIKGNSQLRLPTIMPSNRKQFEKLYSELGFEKAVFKCLKSDINKDKILQKREMVKHKLLKMLRKIIYESGG